jgi:hypothetical protein
MPRGSRLVKEMARPVALHIDASSELDNWPADRGDQVLSLARRANEKNAPRAWLAAQHPNRGTGLNFARHDSPHRKSAAG